MTLIMITLVSVAAAEPSESKENPPEAVESVRPAPPMLPKSPEPGRMMPEVFSRVFITLLPKSIDEPVQSDTFLILKHMLLEPLKFRSNYVDIHA
ncbi:hypothetical protein [Paenibacillus sp. 7541]|nr:hypothetical protein [Paenibacillus sp. 7541]